MCGVAQAIAIPIPGSGGEIFDDNGTIPILFGLFCTISQSRLYCVHMAERSDG